MDCGRITNYYDPLMGRLCPQCIVNRMISMEKNRLHLLGLPIPPDEELRAKHKKFLTMPLIDHSDDIDALHKNPHR